MDKDNLILFPGVDKRLFQLGMERLQENDYEEAKSLFQQAKQLGYQDFEVEMALTVAYYENEDYELARQSAEKLLHTGIGDYFEVIDLYLMSLIQLKQHEEVVHTIETLFEERQVPPEKYEHFHTLLELSRKVTNKMAIEPAAEAEIPSVRQLRQTPIATQMNEINALRDKNIVPYMSLLKDLLGDKGVNPFVQTLALNVLKEHQVSTPVHVEKFSLSGRFIPADLQDLHDLETGKALAAHLAEELENQNPVLMEQLLEIVKRHQFLLYPFDYTPEDPSLWAAAYRGFGHEMYGEKWSKEEMAEENGVTVKELENAVAFIFDLEQSSPVIS